MIKTCDNCCGLTFDIERKPMCDFGNGLFHGSDGMGCKEWEPNDATLAAMNEYELKQLRKRMEKYEKIIADMAAWITRGDRCGQCPLGGDGNKCFFIASKDGSCAEVVANYFKGRNEKVKLIP